ncbi:MAG: hypothetical protein M3R58_00270 [Pseudomonadota bacterium]|nr:hypothetical protein [Pseudomonadota bacterium]
MGLRDLFKDKKKEAFKEKAKEVAKGKLAPGKAEELVAVAREHGPGQIEIRWHRRDRGELLSVLMR